MKRIIAAILAVMLIFSLSACGGSSNKTGGKTQTAKSKSQETQTLTSKDEKYSVMLPDGWKRMEDLNEDADLAMGLGLREKYMVALFESKADLAYTFDEWEKTVREALLSNVENSKLSDPVDITVNGYTAKQYVLDGTVEKINITYLLTYVDGESNYGQILCWTVKSRYNSAEDEFKEITQSVKGM